MNPKCRHVKGLVLTLVIPLISWLNKVHHLQPGVSTPPGTHPRQYLASQGRHILYPPKFVIVVFIIVNSVLTVQFGVMVDVKMHQNAHLHVTIHNFSGGYAPEPPYWEALWRPSPNSIPLASLGSSIIRQYLLAVDATAYNNNWSLPIIQQYESTYHRKPSTELKSYLKRLQLRLKRTHIQLTL